MTTRTYTAYLTLESDNDVDDEQALDLLLETLAESEVDGTDIELVATHVPERFNEDEWRDCWGGGYE